MPMRAVVYQPLVTPFASLLRQWAAYPCRAKLSSDGHYRQAEPRLWAMLSTIDAGSPASQAPPAKSAYRFLAWNIERGIQYRGQLEALRSHAYLKTCDVLLLTEADIGMARSGNRAVAQELARELGMHYVFAPCYLNLSKGAGAERDAPGENQTGLQGNAILSRYPIAGWRRIPLLTPVDPMAGPEKRIGCEVALAASIEFPNRAFTAAAVHLEGHAGQRHRRDQMAEIVGQLSRDPVVLGGDWNTTCNSWRGLHAGMCLTRLLAGMDSLIHNHYLHPERRFERDLFVLLEREGFDYRSCNCLGEATASFDLANANSVRSLAEWVPAWCFACIRWALRGHEGRCPLKLDWFATRGLRAAEPVVVHDLGALSDHSPIGLDVLV